MFWGLVLKANTRYSQTLKKAIHLSNAALDVPSCTDNEVVQVTISHDGNDYIICNLRKNKVEQVTLDLTFKEGEEIAFTSKGNGKVHLTGYLLLDEDENDDDDEEFSDLRDTLLTTSESIESFAAKKGSVPNLRKTKSQKKKKNDEDDDDDDDDDEDEDDLDETFEMENDQGNDDDDDEEEEDDDEDEEDDDDDSEDEAQEPKPKQQKLQNGQAAPKEGVSKKEKQKEKKKQQQQQPNQPKQQQKQQKQQQKQSPKEGEKALQGGVKVEDVVVGSGPEAKPGKKVSVYYEGRLKQNNKVFDSTKQGNGFKFSLGKGEVIKGWDIGIAGMKVGGKRRVVCPPHMAYGAKGHPPVIPPNSTLVFDVELRSVF